MNIKAENDTLQCPNSKRVLDKKYITKHQPKSKCICKNLGMYRHHSEIGIQLQTCEQKLRTTKTVHYANYTQLSEIIIDNILTLIKSV